MQQAVCQLVRRDSSVIKFDKFEIALALFFWLKALTDDGGEEAGVPGKESDDELQKMPHTHRKFKPQARLEPALSHWWQARKADVLTITPRLFSDQKSVREADAHEKLGVS